MANRNKHGTPPSSHYDSQVLTFREWCELNRFSERTGRRILGAPGAPVVTQLSARRIGITMGNNRAWQESRARARDDGARISITRRA